MKNNHKIKLITASLALTTSFSAVGGLGGLNVQSNLGEPFSGTVTVTGEEARILLNGGNASLSDGNLRASVRKSGNNAVINIRSNTPVNDPVLVFQVGVGSQSRQYTAIIDPADYPESGSSAGTQAESHTKTAPARPVQTDETDTRSEAQQSAASRAKLKAKKTQEQQARKEQQKTAAASREKLREQAAAGRQSEPPRGNYKVSRGETLTSIANQVRPSGLSVRETIAAIMTANPKVFPTRNANQILAGRVLNIPSSEELKRLAKQPVPTKQEQPAQAPQPVATDASEPAATASAPAHDHITDAATATASAATQASEPAAATAASTALEPAASSPAEEAAQPAPSASKEESSGLWRWLLFAGLGAIALWLLLKLAGKKKTAVENTTLSGNNVIVKDTDTDFDDEYETHETEIHTPQTASGDETKSSVSTTAATAAAVATVAEAEDNGLDMEDDFDDIFFSEAEAAPVEKTESNFNLDLGSLDREQGGIVSGALTQDEETQKREHADWDNIESTESVYEPETANEFQHVAVEFNAVENADESQKTTAATADSESAGPSDTTAADTPLEFYTEQASDNAVTGQTDSEQSVEKQSEEQPLVQIETSAASESIAETVEIDTLSLTDDADDSAALAAETVGGQPSLAVESEKSVEPETDADDHRASTPDFAVGETAPTAEKAAAAIEATTEPAWTTTTSQDDGFAFQDDGDFDGSVNISAGDAETIEWESINVEDDSRSDDGFISESVGMTAPLEAKYELAQMYVEIGDPEAARETLQELLEESSGSVLEKTKIMLAQLDSK